MELGTGATAKEKDSDDKQNAPDSSSPTGKKTDQDQQILMDRGDMNWFKNTQALKYVQPVFVLIVKDEMKSLQLQSLTDFGRQLCADATADDLILARDGMVQFKHVCPGMVVPCQRLLNIIKKNTNDSVNFYKMLKGTDPQNWLKSPFEFVRLFLEDRMRCDIHDFQECDINALCTIVKRCKPLMQIFDERKIDELRKVRNMTMHPATMSISEQEVKDNIDVILDFLKHIKSLKNTNEVTEAIENVKELRTGDVRLLNSMVVRLIQGWLPGTRIAYEHKSDQAKNQLKLKELDKQKEELIKRLQEEKRELDKQHGLQEEKREFEKLNKELRKRLENVDVISPHAYPKSELSDTTSSGHEVEFEEPTKRTGLVRELFSTQTLSASTSSGDKGKTVHEILIDTGDTNWFKNTQAMTYIQPVFVPIVKDKMKSLQLQSLTDFGRQLCAEATADDIIQARDGMAQFKHVCPGMVVSCQRLLNIIKKNTEDSVNFYQMLKGTDPQNWLKSPFEFARLFLKDWMRCDIQDFQECDITALCTIVKRCKPLMQIFDESKIDELRKVRGRIMHPATISISEQEMEDNIDVILDFLEHIKSLKNTNEVTEAIENVKQLRTGDVRLLDSVVLRLIRGWLPYARTAYDQKGDQAKNQLKDIIYMENKLATLSSGHETTPIRQNKEHEFEAKIEKLTDENQKFKQMTEVLVKLQKEKREFEKQNKGLTKRLVEEKRELQKINMELKKHLENLDVISPHAYPKSELSDTTSSGHEVEFEEPTKRTGLGRELYSTETLSASTSSGDKGKTVKEEPSKLLKLREAIHGARGISASTRIGDKENTVKERRSLWSGFKQILPFSGTRTRSGDEHETVKEELSKPKLPHASPETKLSDRTILDPGHSPAIKCTDVSKIPIKTVKDTRRYYITGMVAISGTQLILADANNECIKLLDLEGWAVIGVKELPSEPHDVTCVPGSKVAVTIPYSQQIHFFTANQNLKQCGVMRVGCTCFGLHCSGDRLFVACKNPQVVQILNMDGEIIKTIQIDPIVYPKYLTCSPDNKFIYVSDIYNDTVICMDMAGSVQWVYNDENYKTEYQMTPQGVCTGDRCIYICSSHEIRVVSPTGANLAVIPLSQTGAKNGAVCYSSQKRTLYVSTFSSDPEQTKYISRILVR